MGDRLVKSSSINIIHTWSSNIQGHRMSGTTFTYSKYIDGIRSHSTHMWSYKYNLQTDINFCFCLILHPSVDIRSWKFFSNIEYPILTVSAHSLLSRLYGSLFTKESLPRLAFMTNNLRKQNISFNFRLLKCH